MMKYTAIACRFVLLWLLCPLVALVTFRFLFGGVESTMDGFLYHVEIRPIAFFGHIVLASVALALVPFQLWHEVRKKRIQLHRWLGRAYGLSVLIAGSCGFWLALTTQSGSTAAWGFGLLAVAWLGTTAYGIALVLNQNVVGHQEWMIRSAALTMAAVTLRIYLGIGAIAGYSYEDIAGLIAWACWVPNLMVAELKIRKRKRVSQFQHAVAN